MTRTLTGLDLPTVAPDERTVSSRLTRGCESLPDQAVVLLATWTLVYHSCLLLRLAVPAAVTLEAAALVICGLVVWRERRSRVGRAEAERAEMRHPDVGSTEVGPAAAGASAIGSRGSGAGSASEQLEGSGPERFDRSAQVAPAEGQSSSATSTTLQTRLCWATVAGAVAAALLLAVNASWPVVAVLWLAAAVGGTGWAVLRLRTALARGRAASPDHDIARDAESRSSTLVAIGWAVALAVLSTFTLWPNPDDLYYVNLSQWIVEHGTYPLRDTIFSDLVFPMSSWPPMASYDALVGTLARLLGVHAATVAYMAVPPIATALSVLALWRLLRAWHVKALALTLSLALVFLLFDGGFGYAAPGNLFLIRIWQGKVILLCLLVPTLLVYALRYAERPTWARAGWLLAGGIAAVGLSTTAMFLVPILAVGGAAPLVLRQPLLALRGFAAMAAYPLATGAFTVAIGGRSADLFGSRELYRFDPEWFGHQIFRDGPLAVIVVGAVLAGALLIPHPMARVTTAVLTLLVGITFVPGFTHLSFDLVGLGPTLWRVSWVASIAALVGVLVSQTATYFSRRMLQVSGPVVLALTLVLFGVPIWSERNGVNLEAPLHWQRGRQSVATAQQAIAQLHPGDIILTPEDLAVTIDVLTTRVKTVAPRDYFMDYLKGDAAFHYGLRLNLVHFANREGHPTGHEVAKALRIVGVDEVCLPRAAYTRMLFLRSLGYEPVPSTPWYRCVIRR